MCRTFPGRTQKENEKNSISILLKAFSILLNSTKHVLRILHALFHLMKNKIQVKENLQGGGVKIKI